MAPLEDAPELAACGDRADRVVDGGREVGVGRPDRDRVVALAEVADHLELGPRSAVAGRDDVVEEDGIGPSVDEIEVRLLDTVVDDRSRGPAQHLEREAVRERPDLLSAESKEVGRDRRVACARHEALREDTVRTREAHPAHASLGHLEAIHDDVEAAAFERRYEVRPVVLYELRAHAELSRDRVGDLHLESDQSIGALRIAVDVRLTALDVAAPLDDPRRADAGEPTHRRRPATRDEPEEADDGHDEREEEDTTPGHGGILLAVFTGRTRHRVNLVAIVVATSNDRMCFELLDAGPRSASRARAPKYASARAYRALLC